MTSIIIAAHNEAGTLGATLDHLAVNPDIEIIVVANGCRDATADVARARSGVVVLDLPQGGKANALNRGEERATSFPRIYLDADIRVPRGAVAALVGALDRPGVLAAVPGRRLVVNGRPWPVRAWAAINARLPVFTTGLFGRGMIAVSREGRERFESFPLMVADDLFLDSMFQAHEKVQVVDQVVDVETPSTTSELLERLTRVRRGSTAMRQAGASGAILGRVRSSDQWSWLRDVVAKEPRLAPAGFTYAALTVIAALRARRGPTRSMEWGGKFRRGSKA